MQIFLGPYSLQATVACFDLSTLNHHIITGDPLHSRAACTQPCNVNAHSRAHCSPGARLCEQWGHGCVNKGARQCASARLCRGIPVILCVVWMLRCRSIQTIGIDYLTCVRWLLNYWAWTPQVIVHWPPGITHIYCTYDWYINIL